MSPSASAPESTRRSTPAYIWVDTLAVLVLSVLALSALTTSFEDRQWVFVAAVALGLGLGWSLLGVALGMGMDLILETLPLPFFLSAGVVALGSSGLYYGIPDGPTLGRVMTGTFTGWRQLVETAPPVESQGLVMLLPYLLGMLLPGAALAMALRSRRAVLPLVPLVLLLVATLLLGLQDPFSVPLQGIGFGVVALMWVGHRAGRIEAGRREVGGGVGRVAFGRVLAGVAVLAVVATLVGVLVDTPTDRARWVLREAVEPYPSQEVVTPLATFRRFREGPANSLADDLLFTVTGAPTGSRLRLAVLDNYDGERWFADPDRRSTDYADRFLRVSRRIDNPGPGQDYYLTIKSRRTWDLDWLPVVGRVQEFRFYGDVAGRRRDDVRYNRSTGTALLPGGLSTDERYSLDVRLGQERLSPQMRPWPKPDDDLAHQAAFLDDAARAWSAKAKTPMQALFAMARQLRSRGRYSDGAIGWEQEIQAGQSPSRLGDGFVNAARQIGNDEQYAATMALLANRIGIPARVAVGARIEPSGKVFGRQVGAWVEVRIATGAWRVLPNTEFMSRRPPSRAQEPLRPIQVPEETELQPEKPTRGEKPPEQSQDEEQDRTGPLGVIERGSTWWLWALLALVLLSLTPLGKAVRRMRRRTATPTALRYAGAWDELLDNARDLGLPVVAGVRAHQSAPLGVPVELARAADQGAFAAESPSEDDAEDFWYDVEDATDEMRASVKRWRRLLAPLNPFSLLPRRR